MSERPTNKRILALDVGRRRVGSAISDALGITAQGLESFEIKGTEDIVNRVRGYLKDFDIGSIVLGKPLKLDGSPTHSSGIVAKIKVELETKLGIPVSLYDERFTSKIAQQSLHQSGRSLRKNKNLLDMTSAVIILTDYLNNHAQR
jgi:putative Holliday junction resolvase